MASAVGLIAVGSLFGGARRDQAARAAEEFQDPKPAPAKYLGAKSCASCHTNESQIRESAPFSIGYFKFNEHNTWKTEDKHSIAYQSLLGQRGQDMARNLKVASVTAPEVGCLRCHSASQEEVANRQGNGFDTADGVSCENCHGPSEKWNQPHQQLDFQKNTTEEREELRMIDLRDPVVQTAQCLSCHIGNVGEGKVVTHEMYAAGHPPLPSIEVSTFSNVIPRHWRLDGEKGEGIRKYLGFKDGQKEETRLVLVGAVVALKTSMKLLADEAVKGTVAQPSQGWPNLARFDCSSCHHDLKRESWRQVRGYQGPPGRPPINEWPVELVELAIDRIGFDDPKGAEELRSAFKTHRDEVHKQVFARPFGRKEGLIKAAGEFASWADALIAKLKTASYTDETANRLFVELVKKTKAEMPEFDAARHVAWALKILAADAGDKLTNRKGVEAVFAGPSGLDKNLNLILPAGRNYKLEENLEGALKTIGDFEPSDFHKAILGLDQALNAEKPKAE
jgi:hypothetical protein